MTAGAAVAATLAALGVLALLPPAVGPPSRRAPVARTAAAAVALAAAGIAAGLAPGYLPALSLLGVTGAGIALVVRRRATSRRVQANAAAVLEVCEVLAGELGAGASPGAALADAAGHWPPIAPVAAGWRVGRPVPDALREVATLPGAGDLTVVAAAWEVSERTGSRLAGALEAVVAALRDRAAVRRVVRSELASARATARLVVALPGLTLVAGSGLGGDPIRFLLTTAPGLAVACAGALLVVAGLWWLEAIAAAVLADAG